MTSVICKTIDHCSVITLNRIEKHNAFDEAMIKELTDTINKASVDIKTNCILLNANGKNFCAGADLNWMKKMAAFSESENVEDAIKLATLLETLYRCPKVTISLVQGKALGGGAGLVAATDFALCTNKAAFAFSEIHLGLVPAVISPYVIDAIGAKAANKLFLTGALFDANKAKSLGLVDELIEGDDLLKEALNFCKAFKNHHPKTIAASKSLVQEVSASSMGSALKEKTAQIIAEIRKSAPAQQKINAFLTKHQ